MKMDPTRPVRWSLVAVYATAMAWVEAAAVFYLRALTQRIVPQQPDPLPIIGGLASVERVREFATLVMLFAVGWLAGRTWRARFGYLAVAFGVWDIFYYVFLKVICGWPHSLLDWDVLFLLPLPWWGPVLAPMLVSLLLVVWGTVASQGPPLASSGRARWIVWLLNGLGVALTLYLFMANALAAAFHGPAAIRAALPEEFNWPLFGLALALMAAPLVRAWGRLSRRRTPRWPAVETGAENPCDRE